MRGWRLLALAAVLALPGCAALVGSHDVAPSGLSRPDEDLRRALVGGGAERGLARVRAGEVPVGDELLRLQYEGLLAHYAGLHEASNASLERAAALDDDRYTRSLSRALLSVLTNDRVLPYDAPPLERAFIHYYGALNYLRLGDPEEAAVEARRLVHRLELLEEEGLRGAWMPLQASLRYFAGAVFEAAGEENDAEVAYRVARRVEGAALPDAETTGSRGNVLVVVERGFIAHRVERSLHVPVWPGEYRLLAVDPEDDTEEVERSMAVARAVVARSLLERARSGEGDPVFRPPRLGLPPECGEKARDAACSSAEAVERARRPSGDGKRERDADPYLLRIAWPDYVDSFQPAGRVEVVGGGREGAVVGEAELSAVALERFEGERLEILAKALLRAVAKHEVAERVEEEVEEEDETAGEVAGALANVVAVLTERADTRCWHLLPDRISLHRISLPPDESSPEVLLRSPDGAVIGRVSLEGVRAPRRGVAIVSVRLWE